MINPFTMIELQSINREMQQKQLINFPITTGSYLMFVNNIIDLALKRKSSIVCVANVQQTALGLGF